MGYDFLLSGAMALHHQREEIRHPMLGDLAIARMASTYRWSSGLSVRPHSPLCVP
jgi:hypothetical protein